MKIITRIAKTLLTSMCAQRMKSLAMADTADHKPQNTRAATTMPAMIVRTGGPCFCVSASGDFTSFDVSASGI